ncbi:hypothetical protein D3C85_770990 [compost metagenome]
MSTVTYNIEGLYPNRGSKGRSWQTWLRDLTEEEARKTLKLQLAGKDRWLKDCFTDLRLVKVTTEVIE